MWILIDTTNMAVLYRHESIRVLSALAHIELPNVDVSFIEETHRSAYDKFTPKELQDLFRSLTNDTDPHSANHPYLVGQIMRLCQTAPQVDVSVFELLTQAMQIKDSDTKTYKYIKGSGQPKLDASWAPAPLLGNWAAAQGLPLPNTATVAPAPAQPPSWTIAPAPTPPKYAPPWAK